MYICTYSMYLPTQKGFQRIFSHTPELGLVIFPYFFFLGKIGSQEKC